MAIKLHPVHNVLNQFPATRWWSKAMQMTALATVVLLVNRGAMATTYLHESFNYPAGNLGSNSPWTNATAQIEVASGTLTYSNYPAVLPDANLAIVFPGATISSYRPLAMPATNGVVYWSCLINFSTRPGSYYIGGLTQSTNALPGGASADPLDLIDNTIGTGSQFKLGVRGKGGTTYYVTNAFTPLTTNTTYLLVLKYNFTNGVAALYLNPPLGTNEPNTADAVSAASSIVPDLSNLYLRSGSSSAGTFTISSLRVASSWAEATPAGSVAGVAQIENTPGGTNAGAGLGPIYVQLEDANGIPIQTNNVSVTLSLTGGAGVFASGSNTVNSAANGLAVFSNLVITTAGNYTITATATGFSETTSGSFAITAGLVDHYSLAIPSTAFTGEKFAVNGMAQDVYGNNAGGNGAVTLGSSGNFIFDGNANGIFGENGDAIATLTAGIFSVNAEANTPQTAMITATDTNGITGTSGAILISTNGVSAQGAQLGAFLFSLQVDIYWPIDYSVNWLTGATGGNGPNMTQGMATHCSAFAGAVTKLLGVYLLRQPDASDINLANNQAVWFTTNTSGWFQIAAPLDAQHMVNTGLLVMASYKSSSGSGHIAVLRPTDRTDGNVNLYGPEECQSGTYNYADTNVMAGFSEHPGAFPNEITYWGHTISYPISPITASIVPLSFASNIFTLNVTGVVGRKYLVQVGTDLKTWATLATFTNSNLAAVFYTNFSISDTSANSTRKYYRTVAQ